MTLFKVWNFVHFKAIYRMMEVFGGGFSLLLGKTELWELGRSLTSLEHFIGLPPTKPPLSIIKEAGLALITESTGHMSPTGCFNLSPTGCSE